MSADCNNCTTSSSASVTYKSFYCENCLPCGKCKLNNQMCSMYHNNQLLIYPYYPVYPSYPIYWWQVPTATTTSESPTITTNVSALGSDDCTNGTTYSTTIN